jgi:phasin
LAEFGELADPSSGAFQQSGRSPMHRTPEQEITMAAPENFQIPPDMRVFAEKSIGQAKQAFDGFITAAQQAVTAFEGHAETARKGARTVAEKAMSFAEQNIAKSFELAQQLVQAKDVQEVLKLQGDFIRSQIQVLSEQARELGESAGQAAKDAAQPPKT